jgi:hypothetical protein
MEPLSVPFIHRSWTETYEGMVTVHGVLRTEEDGLVLEYRSSENYFGAKPSREGEIRTVSIPWSEIQSIEYRRRFWVGGALVLRTRSLRALEGVPAARGTEVSLSVARADRLTARELAANVALALVERRWAALGEADTPPALPST